MQAIVPPATAGPDEAVAACLVTYPWPGNVRELRNAMERSVALTRYDRVAVEDLPEKIRSDQPSHVVVGGENSDKRLSMEEVERRYIQHVLKATGGGNRTLSARILGLDRKTLYRRLQRLEKDDGESATT